MLGVAPSAPDAEIRRAYLRLAREHHPDRHQGSDAPTRRWHEERMRSVNSAWELLGEPARRRAHDRAAGHRAAAPPPTRPEGLGADLPDEDDDVLDASWVLSGRGSAAAWTEPSGTVLRASPRRAWAIAPALLFALGVACIVVALLMSAPGLAAVGALVVLASWIAFGTVPLLAMGRTGRRWRR